MIQVSLFTALLGALLLVCTRRFQPEWWAVPFVRRAVFVVAALAPLGFVLRSVGRTRELPAVSALGSVLAACVILVLALLFSLPVAGISRALGGRLLKVARAESKVAPVPQAEPVTEVTVAVAATPPAAAAAAASNPEPLVTRRALLEVAVAAAPVTAFGLGAAGIVGGFDETVVQQRSMQFNGLPAGLEALRIMQITDLHLGAFFGLSSVPALVAKVAEARPDLLVFTGDFCDHLPFLEPALRMFEEVVPRLGAFAVMGNHEYYRGARATRAIFDKTRIEMMIDSHRVLDVGGDRLVIVGVDDPAGYDRLAEPHVPRAERALDGAPSEGFKLGLCHRPSGFPALAARGIDLTLSGHTHGAQIGIAERSVLEPLLPDWYLWGKYKSQGRQLYTSSGAGHWAAFRLACPSEAPLIVLASG